MKMSIQTDDKAVIRMMNRVEKGIKSKTQKGLAKASAHGVFAIRRHTEKHMGVSSGDVRLFKPYSPSYKKARRKAGRGIKPDLNWSGEMLGSMKFRVRGDNAILFFGRRREAEKAIWNQKTRPFFDLSTKERNKARAVFFKEIRKAIR